MIKFGKKSKDILEVKGNFITDNLKLFTWQKKLYQLYKEQPLRSRCKNCEKKNYPAKHIYFAGLITNLKIN